MRLTIHPVYLLAYSPPLIDVGTVDLIKKREISVVYGSISRFTEDGLILEDGKKLQFDACVLATGFLEKVQLGLSERSQSSR